MGRFGTSWENSRVKSMLRQGLMHRNKTVLYSITLEVCEQVRAEPKLLARVRFRFRFVQQ
jgi:hypothetical protein